MGRREPGRPGGESQQGRVLIVDDDLATRVLLQETVGRLGYEAHVAEDGAEALSRAAAVGYQLLVVDLRMPHVTGAELLRLLGSTRSRDAHRIVFSGSPDSARIAGPGNCCLALEKPFDLRRFISAAESCLGSRHTPPHLVQAEPVAALTAAPPPSVVG